MRDEKKAAWAFAAIPIALLVVAFFVPQAIWHSVFTPPRDSSAKKRPPADSLPPAVFEDFLATYGPPSAEIVDGKVKPHAPIATKWLDYRPEHVRVAFVAAEDPANAEHREWIAMAYIDEVENRPISAMDAGRRLTARRK